MKNPLNQPGADGDHAEGLTERLLRRHNQPIGLVDVNHGERLYDRTAGWVARRFELLDHWKTRYETQDTSGSGNSKFVFAAPFVQSSPVVSGNAPLARSIRQTFSSDPSPSPQQYRVRRHVASSTPTPVAIDSTRERPNLELRSKEDVATAGSTLVGETGNDLNSTIRALAEPNDLRAVETPAIGGQPHPQITSLIPTNNIGRSQDYTRGRSATEAGTQTSQASRVNVSSSLPANDTHPSISAMVSPAAGPSQLRRSGLSVASAPRALSLVAARTKDASRESTSAETIPTRVELIDGPAITAGSSVSLPLSNSDSLPPHDQLKHGPVDERLGQPTVSAPLPVQRQLLPDAKPSGREKSGQTAGSLPLRVQPQPQPQPLTGVRRLTTVTDSISLPVQRQPSPGAEAVRQKPNSMLLRDVPKLAANKVSEPDVAEAPPKYSAPQRLSSTEVQLPSLNTSRPAMLWRTRSESSSTNAGPVTGSAINANMTFPLTVSRVPRSSQDVVARQTEEGMPSSSAGTAPAPREESASSSAATTETGSLDLEQLAQQVGRVLSRQLAVERERRGIKGWD